MNNKQIMNKFDSILAENLYDPKSHIVEIEVAGEIGDFCELIHMIGKLGNGGHSFNIELDPDGDSPYSGGWDGDGSDRIGEIKLDGKILKFDDEGNLTDN